jgi:hypothetical protein
MHDGTRVHSREEHLALVQHQHNSRLSKSHLYFASIFSLLASSQYTQLQDKEGIAFLLRILCMDDHKDAFYHMTFALVQNMLKLCKRHGKLASYLEMVV